MPSEEDISVGEEREIDEKEFQLDFGRNLSGVSCVSVKFTAM